MAIDAPPLSRHLSFETLFNVRDLGGYQGRAGQTLRWNRIYRADNLGRATARDLAVLADLGIRTVVDLRTPREVASSRVRFLPRSLVENHHLPILRETWDQRNRVPAPGRDPADFLAERYLEILVEGAPAIADALRIMALPVAHPLVFHCSLGKDRTGVLAAVLLAVLGVRDEVIAEDYALSSLAVAAFDEWSRHNEPATHDALWQLPEAYLAAPSEAMLTVLAQVRRNSRSMVGFVRRIGVSFEVVEALHRQLLV